MGDLDVSLARIACVLNARGEYLGAENLGGGSLLAFYRKLTWQKRTAQLDGCFAGITNKSLERFRYRFRSVESRSFWGLIMGIRSKQPNRFL